MKTTLLRSISAFVVLLMLAAGPVLAQDMEEDQPDIVETAISADGFNTLVTALQEAELVSTLQGEGPFTVFAPTDEAFAALPDGTLESLLQPENRDQLVNILTYHVVPGRVMAADVTQLEEANTVAGSAISIQISDGNVMLMGDNTAQVIQTDIEASNGVIHVIDTVLMPPSDDGM